MKPNAANMSHALCDSPSVNTRLFVMAWLLELVAYVGCGASSSERVDLAGHVTYAGHALDEAAAGPGGYALIKDGEFDTKVTGRGPSSGSYLARINGFEEQALPGAEVSHGAPLFETYEVKITIDPEQEEINFDVPAKSKR
jgi:hypothetical protein